VTVQPMVSYTPFSVPPAGAALTMVVFLAVQVMAVPAGIPDSALVRTSRCPISAPLCGSTMISSRVFALL